MYYVNIDDDYRLFRWLHYRAISIVKMWCRGVGPWGHFLSSFSFLHWCRHMIFDFSSATNTRLTSGLMPIIDDVADYGWCAFFDDAFHYFRLFSSPFSFEISIFLSGCRDWLLRFLSWIAVFLFGAIFGASSFSILPMMMYADGRWNIAVMADALMYRRKHYAEMMLIIFIDDADYFRQKMTPCRLMMMHWFRWRDFQLFSTFSRRGLFEPDDYSQLSSITPWVSFTIRPMKMPPAADDYFDYFEGPIISRWGFDVAGCDDAGRFSWLRHFDWCFDAEASMSFRLFSIFRSDEADAKCRLFLSFGNISAARSEHFHHFAFASIDSLLWWISISIISPGRADAAVWNMIIFRGRFLFDDAGWCRPRWWWCRADAKDYADDITMMMMLYMPPMPAADYAEDADVMRCRRWLRHWCSWCFRLRWWWADAAVHYAFIIICHFNIIIISVIYHLFTSIIIIIYLY